MLKLLLIISVGIGVICLIVLVLRLLYPVVNWIDLILEEYWDVLFR